MKYMIIGLFLLFAGNIYAQVRGTVKDSTGEAIPGANVFWMNTGQGVTTKEDGSFSITKPSKSHMLIVSFIGFQNDTIHVSSKNQQLDIVLRDGVELNEVNIVTRKLGTMKLRSSVMNEAKLPWPTAGTESPRNSWRRYSNATTNWTINPKAPITGEPASACTTPAAWRCCITAT